MAQKPDETRREIEETRMRIAEAVEELEERVEKTSDWRKWANRYPLETTLIAFGAGFAAFTLVGRVLRGIFSSRGKEVREAPRRGSSVSGLLRLVRPIVTPALTSTVFAYFRGRDQNKRK